MTTESCFMVFLNIINLQKALKVTPKHWKLDFYLPALSPWIDPKWWFRAERRALPSLPCWHGQATPYLLKSPTLPTAGEIVSDKLPTRWSGTERPRTWEGVPGGSPMGEAGLIYTQRISVWTRMALTAPKTRGWASISMTRIIRVSAVGRQNFFTT